MKTYYIISFDITNAESVGLMLANAPEYWGDPAPFEDGDGQLNWDEWAEYGKADVCVWEGDESDPCQELISQHWVSIDNPRKA